MRLAFCAIVVVTSLGAVAHAQQPAPTTVPVEIPYLRSSGARSAYWREKLGPRTRPRVGLVWSGGFRRNQPELRRVNERRNIPLTEMLALLHPEAFYTLNEVP